MIYRFFRPEAPGTPSSSRYLATVRRDTAQPSCAIRRVSCWSDRGAFLSSSPISRWSSALAARPLGPSLLPAPARREKK